MRKVVLPIVAAGFGVFLSSGTASAAIVGPIPCSTVGPQGTELVAGTNVTCPTFDATGGLILNSVTIKFFAGIFGSIELTNNGGQNAAASGVTSSQFSFGPLAGFGIVNPLLTPLFNFTPGLIAAGGTATSGLLSDLKDTTLVNNTILAPYQTLGVGTFDIGVTTLTALTIFGGGGNIAGEQETAAVATAEVTYDFSETTTTVPEPATLTLLGTGLLGLAYRRRRRS